MEGEAGEKLRVNGWDKIFSLAIFFDVLKVDTYMPFLFVFR